MKHGTLGMYSHGKCRCSPCTIIMRKYRQKWSVDNPYKRKTYAKKLKDRYRKAYKELVDPIKDVPCMDCGGRFPPCAMDFDHRDPSIKIFNISAFANQSLTTRKDMMLDEIAKCDIVCANCHRIRTNTKGHCNPRLLH